MKIRRLNRKKGEFAGDITSAARVQIPLSVPQGKRAQLLANELRMSLFRIDLSTVVSKYIGETEKNLRRVFDAAGDGGALLFFDEADALFGKSGEVRDNHDRYANIEIDYLLQCMENYQGLAILAINMEDALDPAFMLRTRFIVNMPFPDEKSRDLARYFPT